MPRRSRLRVPARALARALDRASAAMAWVVLPLALLLFLQWPLRDLVAAGSRQANDIAQWMFALYVAFAVRATTARGAHMAATLSKPTRAERGRRLLERYGEAVFVLPWALFVLCSGAEPTWRSLRGLEAFPDTFNPLYFLIRIAAWLLALLMALQALLVLAGVDPGATSASDGEPRQR